MADLLMEIEAQIIGAKTTAAKQNVGVIREVGDGVARIEGLSDAMLNEMIDLGHGITGLALNLDETEVGVVILGDYTQLEEGDEVRSTGKLLQVPVGKGGGAGDARIDGDDLRAVGTRLVDERHGVHPGGHQVSAPEDD